MKDPSFLLLALFTLLVAPVSGFVVLSSSRVRTTTLLLASNSSTISPEVVEDAKNRRYELEEYEVYSRSLSPGKERAEVLNELEAVKRPKSMPQKILRYPGRLVNSVVNRKKQPGKLILLRCGESTFNANGTFTGWLDPDLTPRGVQQCQHVASVLLAEGFDPDVVYTSRLQRAIKSAWVVLEEMSALYLPVYKSVRLNPRMYGALQGLSKKETAKQVGITAVEAWRNSLKARPPKLNRSDPNHPCHDRRYSDLEEDQIPDTESLLDCQERARPLWEHKIKKDIEQGRTVLVVAHRDSLRGLSKVIDNIGDVEIEEVRVPKAIPFVYRFEEAKGGANDGAMVPIKPDPNCSLTQRHTSASFLETPASLKAAVKELQAEEPAIDAQLGDMTVQPNNKRVSSLQDTLGKLRSEITPDYDTEDDQDDDDIELTTKAPQVVEERWTDDPSQFEEYEYDEFTDDDDNIELTTKAPQVVEDRWTDDPSEFEEYEYDEFTVEDDEGTTVNIVSMPVPKSSGVSQGMTPMLKKAEPFVVLIRHGRTPHNNLGLFTGWEDPPLADEGVEDARNAGRLLKMHNFEFDVCYTSWLTRAIQTAYYALDELDAVWLPIVKSWRLNERMYGDLTGKSKKKIANDYGDDQLKKWRRGYTIRPPPTSSYSPSYPGNDERRTKHFEDIGIAWRETMSRSLEQRKLVIHRKFPKTESLKDCMDRSIPFYTDQIYEEAVKNGKRVLITSHENAIRGILMHLCGIPEYAMNQLHLPNGLPLVYNVKGKCITLLDDGSGKDPMEVHDFGPAAKYLFKPCELDDDFYDSMLKK